MAKLNSPVTPLSPLPYQKPWHLSQGGATPLTKAEAARIARSFLESPDYQRSLQERIAKNNLHPSVEIMLWHYAYGVPTQDVNLNLQTTQEDLSKLSIAELETRAEQLRSQLEEAKQVENSIPAEYKRVA